MRFNKMIRLYCDNCDKDYVVDLEDGYDWECPECGEMMTEMD